MKRNIFTPVFLFAMIFLIGCAKEETSHPKTLVLDEKIALLYEGVPDYESSIRCRHQGWTYTYNVETGNLQNN
ncbi:MAG: hypothetical protein MJZ39_00710 [Bacteroidales bacterium]|nr:hypothetical protein [Bacteroidales bacterium]